MSYVILNREILTIFSFEELVYKKMYIHACKDVKTKNQMDKCNPKKAILSQKKLLDTLFWEARHKGA